MTAGAPETETPTSEPRVVHTCRARIVKRAGPERQAFLEGFPEPVRFGVHTGIAAFYGVTPPEELPATLDYVVAATGG